MGGHAAHIFLLPVSLGLAAASLLFWGFYSPSIGPINPILEPLGLIHSPSHSWNLLSALLSTTSLIVWKYAGLYMLILLVGLQAIPDDLYEAPPSTAPADARLPTHNVAAAPAVACTGPHPVRDRFAPRV